MSVRLLMYFNQHHVDYAYLSSLLIDIVVLLTVLFGIHSYQETVVHTAIMTSFMAVVFIVNTAIDLRTIPQTKLIMGICCWVTRTAWMVYFKISTLKYSIMGYRRDINTWGVCFGAVYVIIIEGALVVSDVWIYVLVTTAMELIVGRHIPSVRR